MSAFISAASAITSNSVLEAIQHEKRISFSAAKCELLKINCNDNDFKVNSMGIKVVESSRYLDDLFNIKGEVLLLNCAHQAKVCLFE